MILLEKSNYLKDNKELMKEYNYEKNKDIDKLTLGSSKKIWWKCSECNNEWEATPKNRFRGGTGCSLCGLKKIGINHNKSLINKKGSLFDNVPELAKEWDYEKNYPLTPKDVTAGSKKRFGGYVKKVTNGNLKFVIELVVLVAYIVQGKKQL